MRGSRENVLRNKHCYKAASSFDSSKCSCSLLYSIIFIPYHFYTFSSLYSIIIIQHHHYATSFDLHSYYWWPLRPISLVYTLSNYSTINSFPCQHFEAHCHFRQSRKKMWKTRGRSYRSIIISGKDWWQLKLLITSKKI